MFDLSKTGSAAHVQHGGKSQAPRADAVCARRKAAFQQIIWGPDLDLSWLMPGVKLLSQDLLPHTHTVRCHQSCSHNLSTLHRLDIKKHHIIARVIFLIKETVLQLKKIFSIFIK